MDKKNLIISKLECLKEIYSQNEDKKHDSFGSYTKKGFAEAVGKWVFLSMPVLFGFVVIVSLLLFLLVWLANR